MTLLLAGIDGGQSSTVAVVADENGRILGRGAAGPADEIGVGSDSTRLRDALRGALAHALRAAGLPLRMPLDVVVAGISGYDGRVHGQEPDLAARRVTLMHDAPVAHAGALSGRRGAVLIAGTGSVAYTTDKHGSHRTFGGWGFLFGDEGSAFRIARDSLAALMRAQDDGDATLDHLAAVVCEFFQTTSLRQLATRVYSGEISRDALAAFAPTALHLGPLSDLTLRAAERLSELAVTAMRAAEVERVALCGGMFGDDRFAALVRSRILARTIGAEIVAPRYDPATGALLLAYRELGLPIEDVRV